MLLRRLASASMVRHIEATNKLHHSRTTSVLSGIGLSSQRTRMCISIKRHFTSHSRTLNSAALMSSKSELVPPHDPAVSELDDFMSVFPELMRDVTAAVNTYDLTKRADASTWLASAMLYNVPKGKRNRGLLTVSTFKLLQSQRESSEGKNKGFHF